MTATEFVNKWGLNTPSPTCFLNSVYELNTNIQPTDPGYKQGVNPTWCLNSQCAMDLISLLGEVGGNFPSLGFDYPPGYAPGGGFQFHGGYGVGGVDGQVPFINFVSVTPGPWSHINAGSDLVYSFFCHGQTPDDGLASCKASILMGFPQQS